MANSRRGFLTGAGAAIGMMPLARTAPAEEKMPASSEAILALFKSLPGDVAIKILAPACERQAGVPGGIESFEDNVGGERYQNVYSLRGAAAGGLA